MQQIISAAEAIDQGATAVAMASIARYHTASGNHALAQRIRQVAEEIASITGAPTPGSLKRFNMRRNGQPRQRAHQNYGAPRSARQNAGKIKYGRAA